MPQLEPAGGDDLGAPDELIAFQDEGEEQDKGAGRGSAHGDLDELKSSLVSETENRGTGGGTGTGSDSEVSPGGGGEAARDGGWSDPRAAPLTRFSPQAERPPQPRESFQKPRDYLAEGTGSGPGPPLPPRSRSPRPGLGLGRRRRIPPGPSDTL